MKVLVVSDAQSVHTQRWVSSLKERGIETVLYTIKPVTDNFYSARGIRCIFFDLFSFKREKKGFFSAILQHIRAVTDLKRAIKEEKPDILHAHFATSYALIAALAGFHPFIVSVWGSDVYLYPKRSPLNKFIVKYSLGKANKILSTSHVMAKECARYTDKPIGITPFGVDTELFRRRGSGNSENSGNSGKEFVVGCVKTLAPNYGTDTLIRAFKIVVDNNPGLNCRLELVGKGAFETRLKELADELDIAGKVIFRGFVVQSRLPELYSSFSIACYLSISESFGVSAIEAMACNCPVVASDADGFTEVIEDGHTGVIVPKNNPEAAANAMQRFIDNPQDIEKFGTAARERVCTLYKWSKSVDTMISIYKSVL